MSQYTETIDALRAERERFAEPFCVALLDIDAFKGLNDQHGHQAGDQALVDVAQTARAALRTTDQIGRWGGEEFLLVLPQSGIVEASAAVERVRLSIERAVSVGGRAVTVSGGVTSYAAADTPDALVRRADAALYQAKATGRNRVLEWRDGALTQ